VGKFFIRVFPDKSISKKPIETRMGKGKGSPVDWVAVVKRERIIAEISGVDRAVAKAIFKSVAYKLPIKVAFVESLPKVELVASEVVLDVPVLAEG
jgi:large subunit ribosomal protein L16